MKPRYQNGSNFTKLQMWSAGARVARKNTCKEGKRAEKAKTSLVMLNMPRTEKLKENYAI